MPQTLLLADDSVTIQRVIELTFADEDIDVVAVSDGDQAIARLEADPPDIVLADVGMPGKSGYEVADYIRRSPRLAHIPVVLLTGAFEPVDQDRATQAGCDGVLAKPFEPQLVIGRVKELLARPRRDAAEVGPLPTWSPASIPHEATTPSADPRLDGVARRPAESTDQLDDYFDQLDAAFANRSAGQSRDVPDAGEPFEVSAAIDWFRVEAAASGTEGWDIADGLGTMTLPDPSPVGIVPAAPPRPVQAVVAPAPADPRTAIVLPTLADAFAMLLAAEQGQASASAPAAATYTDALVERVTRRVLDQLSDRAVREAVTDIVTKVAERLVLEEIDRIKSSIRTRP